MSLSWCPGWLKCCGTASSVLFCIALRCSPNLSLKARLVCLMYSAGVFVLHLRHWIMQMRFLEAHVIVCLIRWVWPVFLNVHDDIPSLMKGQVLHLMEVHFFMEGVFEVNIFDLLLIKIYLANRLAVEAGRKKNWRAKLGLEPSFVPQTREIFFALSPRSTWAACVQLPPPLPSVKIGEGEGGLYTGSTWEPVRRLTEKVPLSYNYHIRKYRQSCHPYTERSALFNSS